MIFAVFKTMWLRLWRDKGAFVLAFVLPGFIFAVFAAIFANASGGNLDLRVALADVSNLEETHSFSQSLQDSDLISVSFDENWTQDDISTRIRLGQEDVGVVLFDSVRDPSAPSIRIIQDPSRKVAATVLKGQIRQMLINHSGIENTDDFETVSALGQNETTALKDPTVTYYIGATAILFLLFSAMQGAAISIDERRNGISDRLMVGPIGALGMLSGKFVFLTLVGFFQAEDGIRDVERSRGLGDVYKRQIQDAARFEESGFDDPTLEFGKPIQFKTRFVEPVSEPKSCRVSGSSQSSRMFGGWLVAMVGFVAVTFWSNSRKRKHLQEPDRSESIQD